MEGKDGANPTLTRAGGGPSTLACGWDCAVARAFTVSPWGPADIDECVTGIHNCSVNETCFNIQGGFRCLAFECPENYRRSADT